MTNSQLSRSKNTINVSNHQLKSIKSQISTVEKIEIDDLYYWRNFRFREAEKFFKDNFNYLPEKSLIKYLNLWCVGRLIIYETLILGFQNLSVL